MHISVLLGCQVGVNLHRSLTNLIIVEVEVSLQGRRKLSATPRQCRNIREVYTRTYNKLQTADGEGGGVAARRVVWRGVWRCVGIFQRESEDVWS